MNRDIVITARWDGDANVWLATSTISMAIPLRQKITFSRNMVAVRGSEGWVLLNPVRLSESTRKRYRRAREGRQGR